MGMKKNKAEPEAYNPDLPVSLFVFSVSLSIHPFCRFFDLSPFPRYFFRSQQDDRDSAFEKSKLFQDLETQFMKSRVGRSTSGLGAGTTDFD